MPLPSQLRDTLLSSACPHCGHRFERRASWFKQFRAFKIDKAHRELGYVPKIGIEEGLKATADWYKENGYLQIAAVEECIPARS